MRVYHRYLGFFLAGIMAIYALSGVLMIFRTTDFLKVEQVRTSKLPTGIPMENIGRELRIREFKVLKEEGDKVLVRGKLEAGNLVVLDPPYSLGAE